MVRVQVPPTGFSLWARPIGKPPFLSFRGSAAPPRGDPGRAGDPPHSAPGEVPRPELVIGGITGRAPVPPFSREVRNRFRSSAEGGGGVVPEEAAIILKASSFLARKRAGLLVLRRTWKKIRKLFLKINF
jgi:hypothetical protein